MHAKYKFEVNKKNIATPISEYTHTYIYIIFCKLLSNLISEIFFSYPKYLKTVWYEKYIQLKTYSFDVDILL